MQPTTLLLAAQAERPDFRDYGIDARDHSSNNAHVVALRCNRIDWLHWFDSLWGTPQLQAYSSDQIRLRVARFNQDRLWALLLVGVAADSPKLDWVSGLVGQPVEAQIRPSLLSLTAPQIEDRGRLICNCFRVYEPQIKDAIVQGANSVEALQKTLRSGTHCGSCIKELDALVKA